MMQKPRKKKLAGLQRLREWLYTYTDELAGWLFREGHLTRLCERASDGKPGTEAAWNQQQPCAKEESDLNYMLSALGSSTRAVCWNLLARRLGWWVAATIKCWRLSFPVLGG